MRHRPIENLFLINPLAIHQGPKLSLSQYFLFFFFFLGDIGAGLPLERVRWGKKKTKRIEYIIRGCISLSHSLEEEESEKKARVFGTHRCEN